MKRLVLVDGNIPAGKGCPWHSECGLKMDRCPTEEKPRLDVNFSCAVARAFAMVEESKERKFARKGGAMKYSIGRYSVGREGAINKLNSWCVYKDGGLIIQGLPDKMVANLVRDSLEIAEELAAKNKRSNMIELVEKFADQRLLHGFQAASVREFGKLLKCSDVFRAMHRCAGLLVELDDEGQKSDEILQVMALLLEEARNK